MSDARPLIVHVIFRFDYGGLENGLVNLINGSPGDRFRHAIIALTESTDFSRRLQKPVPVYALGKRPGRDPMAYLRLFRLLRTLRPAAVHTRNIGTLDCAFIAFMARVPVRIHGEHGWDIYDPDGKNPKYRLLRQLLSRFVDVFVTVSDDLRRWLISTIGIPTSKVTRICNGVDVERFRPPADGDPRPVPDRILGPGTIVVGSVTRFSEIKDPMNLVEAFIRLRAEGRGDARSLRLMMIGDGELRPRALARLEEAGAAEDAWLPGSRNDIPALMRCMDVFVLGSLREGISNTILEAMSSGLPVVATATGGNAELILRGESGALVPPADHEALAIAIETYVRDGALRRRHGARARERAVTEFSIGAMLVNYCKLYDNILAAAEG